VTKILTIGDKAQPKDFERWAKEGIGFYRAYDEFAKPTPSKMKKGGAKPSTEKVERVGPDSWTADKKAGKGITDVDADIPAAEQAKKVSGNGGATAKAAAEEFDWTVTTSDRLDQDRKTWPKLLGNMTKKSRWILEPSMVLEVWKSLEKKESVYRNAINVCMGDDHFREEVVKYIKENPQQFDGISVEEKPAKK
jgi:hypothetical protein